MDLRFGIYQVTKILYATEDDFVSPDDLEKENGDAVEAPPLEDGAKLASQSAPNRPQLTQNWPDLTSKIDDRCGCGSILKRPGAFFLL